LRYKILIALALFILIVPGLFLFNSCTQPEPSVDPKAAIVDQLYALEPNQFFIDKTTTALQNNGLTVDYYHGDEITVDFYRKLPELGFRYLHPKATNGNTPTMQWEIGLPRPKTVCLPSTLMIQLAWWI
jgi:hypothetical protein